MGRLQFIDDLLKRWLKRLARQDQCNPAAEPPTREIKHVVDQVHHAQDAFLHHHDDAGGLLIKV